MQGAGATIMLAGRTDKELPMNWILKPWSELTTDELYELLALRAEVFVVEQTCAFQDLDGLDRREGVWHLLGYQGDHVGRLCADHGARHPRRERFRHRSGGDLTQGARRRSRSPADQRGGQGVRGALADPQHLAGGTGPSARLLRPARFCGGRGKAISKTISPIWGCAEWWHNHSSE